MKKLAPLLLAILFTSCALKMDYLNPTGIGKARTIGNPCPHPYRVMEVKSKKDPDLRIYVSAFWKGEYNLKSTTLFVVVTDRKIWGYQVGQFYSPLLNQPRQIRFPNGSETIVTLSRDKVVKGELFKADNNSALIQKVLILSLPIAGSIVNSFSVRLPRIDIDREHFDLGEVVFTKNSDKWWLVINC